MTFAAGPGQGEAGAGTGGRQVGGVAVCEMKGACERVEQTSLKVGL